MIDKQEALKYLDKVELMAQLKYNNQLILGLYGILHVSYARRLCSRILRFLRSFKHGLTKKNLYGPCFPRTSEPIEFEYINQGGLYRVQQRFSVAKSDNSDFERIQFLTNNDKLLVLHAFYKESAIEIIDLVQDISGFDLLITTPNADLARFIKNKYDYDNIKILICENKGRDVRPFLISLSLLQIEKYNIFIKLHTKKSSHTMEGMAWYYRSVYSLIGSDLIIKIMLAHTFDYPLMASVSILSADDHKERNWPWLEYLTKTKDYARYSFSPGTMFIGNKSYLNTIIKERLCELDFEEEEGQLDGTLAHAIERYFGIICEKAGGNVVTLRTVINKYNAMS